MFHLKDHKIKHLDEYYSNKADKFAEKLSFEEKVSLYQKKIEDQAKSEYQEKVFLSFESFTK